MSSNAVTRTVEGGERIADAVLDLLGRVPDSNETASEDPRQRARQVALRAARNAALTSGGLALPPGPLGWLTVVPELVAVWKLQAQMVSDIAAIYGSKAQLTREQMLYCLFRHTAAQAVRDLVVRMGERYVVGHVSVRVLQGIARKIGIRISQHALGKGVARLVPVIGAVGVGAYAFYDTHQVAMTAIKLFQPPAHPRRALPAPAATR